MRAIAGLALSVGILLAGAVAPAQTPAYVRDEAAWKAANADAASRGLSAIGFAQDSYKQKNGAYAPSLEKLKSAGFLGTTLGKGKRYGYAFKVVRGDKDGFALRAAPATQGKTGDRIYLWTSKGRWHTDDGSEPKEGSPQEPVTIDIKPKPKVTAEAGSKPANEIAAVEALSEIWAAQSNLYGSPFELAKTKGYAKSLADLAKADEMFRDRPPTNEIAKGTYKGYKFTVRGEKHEFSAVAVPEKPGVTGDRAFFIDENQNLRFTPSGSAPDELSEPIAPFYESVGAR